MNQSKPSSLKMQQDSDEISVATVNMTNVGAATKSELECT